MQDSDYIIEGEQTEQGPDRMVGFFASVVAALLISGVLIYPALALFSGLVGTEVTADMKRNMTSALLLGVVLSDPIGAYMEKRDLKRTLAKAFIGMSIGGFLQHFVITPVAGAAVSQMVFIILLLVLLPALIVMQTLERFLGKRGIVISDIVARTMLYMLRLPRPIPIILAVLMCYLLLRLFDMSLAGTLAMLGGAFYLLFARALRIPLMDDFDVAVSAKAEDEGEPELREFDNHQDLALFELMQFAAFAGPSALFIAALAWLAGRHLPALIAAFGLPLPVYAMIAIGVALAFLVALAYGGVMLGIARTLGRWPRGDFQVRAEYLFRLMSLRP